MAQAVINSHPCEFMEGVSILEAARTLGVDIPTLCHDERVRPIGSCRMCLVQVEGNSRPVTACNTPLTPGTVISTHTAALENERRMLLKMLAQDHPGEGLRETPEKPFYRYALKYGLTESDFNGSHTTDLLDDSHPYIHVDMSQCIVCYRFATFHRAEVFLNRVTSPYRDRHVKSPEYKITAVQIEKE